MRRLANLKGFPSRPAHRTGPACAGVLRTETVARALRLRTVLTPKRSVAR